MLQQKISSQFDDGVANLTYYKNKKKHFPNTLENFPKNKIKERTSVREISVLFFYKFIMKYNFFMNPNKFKFFKRKISLSIMYEKIYKKL